MRRNRNIWLGLLASFACMMVAPAAAQQQRQKPNLLVMGDDIGFGIYPDGMVEHDGQVSQLLKKLDDAPRVI